MEFFQLFLSTVLLRPYVFFFLALFLAAAVWSFGRARALFFLLITWALAFVAEYSSVRNGFPFGPYVYLENTRGRELYISNVPFMDSLSFTFLAYAAYSLALAFCLPVARLRGQLRLIDAPDVRRSWGVWLLAVCFFVWIDVVIDPAAVRGDRWFLGKIFYYPDGGIYFGVPIANFVGWGVVGGASIGAFILADRWLWPDRPARPLLSAVWLYYLILGFNLAVTFWIGEPLLGLAGTLIHLPILLLLLVRLSLVPRSA
ncbi:MAG: carotenoid biosynthesis protein [Nitrospirota bacterium]